MCLVIDTDCLSRVFDKTNRQHKGFAPVLDWISTGRGRMIYGGTKYNDELRRAAKFVPVVAELERKGRTVHMEDARVDGLAAAAKAAVPDAEFNDEHLVALVIASRCCVVCTKDNAAMAYLKRPELFRHEGVSRPKIYNGHRSHQRLCCDDHIVESCR